MKKISVSIFSILLASTSCFAASSPAKTKSVNAKAAGVTIQMDQDVNSDVLQLSENDFNILTFPSDAAKFWFSPDAPEMTITKFPDTKKAIMLSLEKEKRGNLKPFTFVIYYSGGEIQKLTAQFGKFKGANIDVSTLGGSQKLIAPPLKVSAKKQQDKTIRTSESESDSELVSLAKYVVEKKEPPSGYESIRLPKVTTFDKFSVIPMSAWSDGNKRIMLFSLVANQNQTAVVAPSNFFRPGILAVQITGDVVDEKNSPDMIIIEEEATNE